MTLLIGIGFVLLMIGGFVFVSLPSSDGQYDLDISIKPKTAKITVSGNGEELTYEDGMSLMPGMYMIKSTAKGYRQQSQEIEIKDTDVTLNIEMKKVAVKKQDEFIKGLNIPSSVNKKRLDHIRASMGLYVFKHKSLLKCIKTQCAELGKLQNSMLRLKDTTWKKSGYEGRLVIEKGSQTNLADCPWKLEVEESLKHTIKSRSLSRT